MTLCPSCIQPMERVTPDDQEAYADLVRGGAFQVEQAVYWDHGLRRLAWHYDPSDEV